MEAKEVKCSWCGQKITGRWIGIRIPLRGLIRYCERCSFGWANLFAYGAGVLGAVNRRSR